MSSVPRALQLPLTFRPQYQVVVWGGRRLAPLRSDLPEGPVGESWELADHERGMSVVDGGELAGTSLRELVSLYPEAVVGPGFQGDTFPLMVKLIDASDRLSVQVHPDDALARAKGLPNGKTECWYFLADGGELFQGTRPGTTREAFQQALSRGAVESLLNRFEVSQGDFFFLDARTVHALGKGCFLYEIQQTADVTYRVYDWGRVGLDGKPRPLHVEDSLETIDFRREGFGPAGGAPTESGPGTTARPLAECAYFRVAEQMLRPGAQWTAPRRPSFSVVICTEGEVELRTSAGAVALGPCRTALVPAAAGTWEVKSGPKGARLLVTDAP